MYTIGTKVRIKKESDFYLHEDSTNPIDTEGKIIEVNKDDEFCYRIKWKNKMENTYRKKDLELWDTTPEYEIF